MNSCSSTSSIISLVKILDKIKSAYPWSLYDAGIKNHNTNSGIFLDYWILFDGPQ